jgi:hypothetical protein
MEDEVIGEDGTKYLPLAQSIEMKKKKATLSSTAASLWSNQKDLFDQRLIQYVGAVRYGLLDKQARTLLTAARAERKRREDKETWMHLTLMQYETREAQN